MLMKFGWGQDPTPEDMPYRVESYSIEAAAAGDVNVISDIEPQRIEMKISIAPENASRGVNLWSHGINQFIDVHASDDDKGKGKIVIYRGEGVVGQSILEIRFSGAWIARLDQSCSASDDITVFDIVIAATTVKFTSEDGADVELTNQHRYSQIYH